MTTKSRVKSPFSNYLSALANGIGKAGSRFGYNYGEVRDSYIAYGQERSYFYDATPLSPTHYVSTNGNDITGTGTESNPWLTLYKASTQLASGDVLFISAGTYIESQQATWANGVSIIGERALGGITTPWQVKVMVTYAGSSSDQTNAWFNSPKGSVTVGEATTYFKNIFFDGGLVSYNGFYLDKRSNVKFNGCKFERFLNYAVTFKNSSGTPNTAPSTFAVGNEIYNYVINDCSRYGAFGASTFASGAVQISGQDGFKLHNGYATAHHRSAGKNGFVLKYLSDGTTGGFNKNTKIYESNIQGNVDAEQHDFVIELWNLYGGNEIYNCHIIGSIDMSQMTTGVDSSTYPYGMWIHDVEFGDPEAYPLVSAGNSSAIVIEITMDDVLIERVSSVNVGTLVTLITQENTGGVPALGFDNIVIKNSLALNGNLISSGTRGGRNTSTANLVSVQNCIGYYGSAPSTIGDGIAFDNCATFTNLNLSNNILIGYPRAPILLYKFKWHDVAQTVLATSTFETVTIENNLYYQCGNTNALKLGLPEYGANYPATTVTTLVNTGHVIADPQLTLNPPVVFGDLEPLSSSPAKDVGVVIAGVTTDFLNNARTGTMDIGAYNLG